MADEKTEWTEGIEKAGEAAFKLGDEMASLDHCTNETGKVLDLLLGAAREMDKEIIRLQSMLGVEATDEAVDEQLDLYGNAYLYHGRLLNPTKVRIKRLKLSSKEAKEEGTDIEVCVNGKTVSADADCVIAIIIKTNRREDEELHVRFTSEEIITDLVSKGRVIQTSSNTYNEFVEDLRK